MKRNPTPSLLAGKMHGPLVPLGSVLYERAPEVVPAPSVNVWDQCLKFGKFEKENLQGELTTTVFDEVSCGQMMDYFKTHKNELWMDAMHKVLRGDGRALCYHNALCLVSQGKITRFESKGEVSKPTLEDLKRPDGTLPEDGLYAHRYQLTSLGLDEKEGLRVFKWVSPFFEQTPTYRLINITATNDPFLDGVALAYEHTLPQTLQHEDSMDETMMQKLMEDAGCKEGDSVEEKLQKMTAYAKKMSEMLQKQKEAMALKTFEENKEDEEESDNDEVDDKKDDFAEKEKPKEKEEENSKKQALARQICKELGLPSDPEMARGKLSQYKALSNQLKELQTRLEKTEAERLEEKRIVMEKHAERFAQEALEQKRWKVEHKGSEEATFSWLKKAYLRNSKEAEEMLHPVGTFGMYASQVMSRYTEGGAPYGVDGRKSALAGAKHKGKGASLNQEALRIQAEQEKVIQKPFSYERALALAERQHPHLAQSYSREVLNQEEESWA